LLKETSRKYVPGIKLPGGEVEGNAATICVAVAVSAVNVTLPNLIVGLEPNPVPASVSVLFP